MTTAVDSMVLIDLFQQEPKWAPRAATAIDRAIRSLTDDCRTDIRPATERTEKAGTRWLVDHRDRDLPK